MDVTDFEPLGHEVGVAFGEDTFEVIHILKNGMRECGNRIIIQKEKRDIALESERKDRNVPTHHA
jgi:hypothetical protein